MNANLQFDFVVDKTTNTINITREFAADVTLVWECYSKSEYLDMWWAPKPWKAVTKHMHFTEGGTWLYAMVGPAGEEHWGLCEYTKIVLRELIAGTDCFCDSEANKNEDLPESTWQSTFTQTGTTTVVQYQVKYADLTQLEAIIAMGFKEGMTMALNGLDELLSQLQSKKK